MLLSVIFMFGKLILFERFCAFFFFFKRISVNRFTYRSVLYGENFTSAPRKGQIYLGWSGKKNPQTSSMFNCDSRSRARGWRELWERHSAVRKRLLFPTLGSKGSVSWSRVYLVSNRHFISHPSPPRAIWRGLGADVTGAGGGPSRFCPLFLTLPLLRFCFYYEETYCTSEGNALHTLCTGWGTHTRARTHAHILLLPWMDVEVRSLLIKSSCSFSTREIQAPRKQQHGNLRKARPQFRGVSLYITAVMLTSVSAKFFFFFFIVTLRVPSLVWWRGDQRLCWFGDV